MTQFETYEYDRCPRCGSASIEATDSMRGENRWAVKHLALQGLRTRLRAALPVRGDVQRIRGGSMSYEEYAKALEGEPLLHVDWECPQCGGDMDHVAFDYQSR